ncbi:class F sortase [Streptomyces coeruleoprunus]|uniref:Class F sortase n=1 Tax=Streptomyces coeruleoprunus TaxID=285563 RepID=A0ABV9X8R9_9ACTN
MTLRDTYGRVAAACATAALLLVTGCAGTQGQAPRSAPAAQRQDQQPAHGGSAHGRGPSGAASPGQAAEGAGARELARAAPREISIPSIAVSSTLEDLGQQKDGTMETPRDPDKAGWYVPGPAPGSRGPAVIAGHVSWNGAPSVFHRLSSLKPGDRIDVAREDGSTAEFTVDRVGQYAKNRFPTVEVYKNIDHAGLRLITCGGRYDPSKRYYADNVVVFARLTGSR